MTNLRAENYQSFVTGVDTTISGVDSSILYPSQNSVDLELLKKFDVDDGKVGNEIVGR